MVDGRRRCPFCPFRSFAQLRLLRTHVHKHHTAKNQFVYSGTKQVKVILALYDHAASSQTSVSDFLQASASLMRRTIEPALGERISYIDKQIRLVLDATGPRYVNLSAIGSTLHVRRARNLYYTHSFADLLLREMIMGHAQVRTLAVRCHMAAMEAGSRLSTLLPTWTTRWTPMLEDIASSNAFQNKMEKMTEALMCGDEWHYISMDATLKLCMKVICPNLKSLMLDPIHLAIVYEYGFWNKKSAGSKQLRRILLKFVAVDTTTDQQYWQSPFDGSMARPLGDEESRVRNMILDCSMSDSDTARLLDSLNPDVPFMRRLDFIKAVAALCRRYKNEVTRKAAGPNKEIN
ncbi:unnamed protein product, partial [Symbiodinium sp. CCMP2456]